MNFLSLAQDLGLEEAEYLELIELFIETGRSDLREIEAGTETGNAERVIAAAHSLKGASANLGLKDLYELSRGIEEKGRQGLIEEAASSVQPLREGLDRIADLTGR